jgi:hypothetical protein
MIRHVVSERLSVKEYAIAAASTLCVNEQFSPKMFW